MLFKKSRSEQVADSASDLLDTVKDKLGDSDALTQVKDSVADKASEARDALAEVDTDQVKADTKQAAAEAKKRLGRTKVGAKVADSDQVAAARDRVENVAGMTRDQASQLFNDEWMPRIHHALAAASASTAAGVSKLPDPAQDQVAKVAPDLVKRKKKGRLLILIGLATLAGAGYVYWQGQEKKKAATATAPSAPGPDAQRDPQHAIGDDPAGTAQGRVEQAVAGDSPDPLVGRHAARE